MPGHTAALSPDGVLSRADIRILCAEARAAMPAAAPMAITYAVSWDVVAIIVGRDWIVRNLPHETRDPYLSDDSNDGSVERFIGTHRIIELARHLYEAQHLEGFRAMALGLRSRELVGAAAELRTAHLLQINGRDVRFVEPSGRKGSDFDQIVVYEGAEVAIEVKGKRDATPYSRNSLRNSLVDARRQLPSGGPGIVAVQVPRGWPTNEACRRETEGVVGEVLRNSGRVNAIVVMWEEWVPIVGDGYACVVRFQTTENASPRVAVPRLSLLLKQMMVGSNPALLVTADAVWGCFDDEGAGE